MGTPRPTHRPPDGAIPRRTPPRRRWLGRSVALVALAMLPPLAGIPAAPVSAATAATAGLGSMIFASSAVLFGGAAGHALNRRNALRVHLHGLTRSVN